MHAWAGKISVCVQVQYSADSSDPAVSIRVEIMRLLPMPELVASEQQALSDIYSQCAPQPWLSRSVGQAAGQRRRLLARL